MNVQSTTTRRTRLHYHLPETSGLTSKAESIMVSIYDTNEQLIAAALLNDELSEYVTKATIYTNQVETRSLLSKNTLDLSFNFSYNIIRRTKC